MTTGLYKGQSNYQQLRQLMSGQIERYDMSCYTVTSNELVQILAEEIDDLIEQLDIEDGDEVEDLEWVDFEAVEEPYFRYFDTNGEEITKEEHDKLYNGVTNE